MGSDARTAARPEADKIEFLKHREDSFDAVFLDQTGPSVKLPS